MSEEIEHDVCSIDPGSLATRHCVPCRGGVPPLAPEVVSRLARELGAGWIVVDGHHLEKRYAFADFRGALACAVRIGEIADAEGHHPVLHVSWGTTRVEIWTHKIDGLTESDFILAARIEQIEQQAGPS